VWKVQRIGTDKAYAMKEMHKGKIILKKSVESIVQERELLAMLKHPFIINMHFAF
jgi:serine/threonine protein kinase